MFRLVNPLHSFELQKFRNVIGTMIAIAISPGSGQVTGDITVPNNIEYITGQNITYYTGKFITYVS